MNIDLPHRKSRYNPKELSAQHREVIRLDLLGVPVTEISDKMEISRHTVRYILASPLALAMRNELQTQRDDSVVDVTKRLADLCPNALEVIEKTLNGTHEEASLALRIKTAESVLDRAGYGKITRTQNTSINTSLSADDILELRRRAQSAAMEKGIVIQCQPA